MCREANYYLEVADLRVAACYLYQLALLLSTGLKLSHPITAQMITSNFLKLWLHTKTYMYLCHRGFYILNVVNVGNTVAQFQAMAGSFDVEPKTSLIFTSIPGFACCEIWECTRCNRMKKKILWSMTSTPLKWNDNKYVDCSPNVLLNNK